MYDYSASIETLAYHSLMGLLEDSDSFSWIEPIFVEGHPCHETYAEAMEIRDRICDRLEVYDDPDCQNMVDLLLHHSKILAEEMFRQGIKYQKMLDESIVPKENSKK